MTAREQGWEKTMTYFDYKAVPAPRRMKKVKGVKSAEDLFALTLTEAINEHARQGWDYVRTESLTVEAPAGWFRRGSSDTQTVLVFRQERGTLGPRLASAGQEGAAAEWNAETRREPAVEPPRPKPPATDAEPAVEPAFAETGYRIDDQTTQTPLHPGPRLGPAERA
jgi:hypothetical protein